MKREVKMWSLVAIVMLLSSVAAAVQKPALQQPTGTETRQLTSTQEAPPLGSAVAEETQAKQQPTNAADQIVIGAQDAITAADADGGRLSSRDLIIIIALGVGLLVLIAIL